MYEIDDGKLVLPQLVMRTQEVTRAIIRIEGGNIENLSVDMDLSTDKPVSRKRRFTLSEEEFFSELAQHVSVSGLGFARQIIDDMQDLGCEIQWRQSSFVIRYPDPFGSSQLLTLLVVSKRGEVYIGWLTGQLENINLPVELGDQLNNRFQSLFMGCEIDPMKADIWSLKKIIPKYDDILAAIKQFVSSINAVSV